MSLPPILELEQLDNTLTSLEPIEDLMKAIVTQQIII